MSCHIGEMVINNIIIPINFGELLVLNLYVDLKGVGGVIQCDNVMHDECYGSCYP